MSKQKKNSGITLIALVISIIVILILAGISINATIGNNGIIPQAQRAKLKKEESDVETELLSGLAALDTEYYQKATADNGLNIYSIYNISGLQKYVNGKINGFNYSKNNGTTIYYSNENGSYTVKINSSGQATTYTGIYVNKNEEVYDLKLNNNETVTLVSEVDDVVWALISGNATIDSSTGKLTRNGSGTILVKGADKTGNIVATIYITDTNTISTTDTNVSNAIATINLSSNSSSVTGYILPNTSDSSKYSLVIKGTGEADTVKLSSSEKNDPYYNYKDKIIEITVDDGVTSLTNSKIETLTNTKTITLPKTMQTFETVVKDLPIETANYNIENYTREINDGNISSIFNYETLKNIYFGNDVKSIPDYAFYYNENIEYVNLQKNVEEIGNFAFAFCVNLKNINLGNKINSIGVFAFYYCKSLTTITIPESVEFIGSSAFSNDTSLKNVNYNAINSSSMGYDSEKDFSVFSNSAVENLNIGNRVEKIPLGLFSKLTSLKSIEIPDSVVTIENYAFSGDKKLSKLQLGNSVKTIGAYAFKNCKKLKELTIPESVTRIETTSFDSCDNIVQLNYNAINCNYVGYDSEEEEYISVYGMLDNDEIELNIGNKVEIIPNGIFAYFTITSVTIPNSVKTIDDYAFYDCEILKELNLGNGLQQIGVYSFAECNELEKLTIPDSVEMIDSCAFYDCESLTELNLGNGLQVIGFYSFAECNKLTNLTLPKSLKNIYPYAFLNCTSLTTLNYNAEDCSGENTVQGGNVCPAFYNCSITTVNIGSTVKKLNGLIFTAMLFTSIEIPSTVEYIAPDTDSEYGAFWYCNSLEKITVKKAKYSISGAPWGATNMTEEDVIWEP
jgi:hypothetical protein